MKQVLIIVFLFSAYLAAVAQQTDFRKRYAFAKSYIGMDFNYFVDLRNSSFIDNQDQIQPFQRNNFLTPSLNIGGTHFWGHADFFVSLATSPVKTRPDEVENSIGFRAITGMRIFPIAIKDNALRPYLSYKFAPIRLNQHTINGERFRTTQVKSLIGGGLAFQTPKLYAYAGYELIPNRDATIYLSRTQTASSSFPNKFLTVGINYLFESTAGSYAHPMPKLDSLLHRENSLGLFFGIGPSASFPVQSSDYIADLYPFLDDKSMPNTFPEITLGYHFSRYDFIVSANFRPIRQERNAFSFQQHIRRNSFGVEAYKFLFDYHGFAPFAGAGVLLENIRLTEKDQNVSITDRQYSLATPSIVFGWDIRPARRADIWLLRTNLRYLPLLTIENQDKKLSFQHLEFNFIQLVIYPQRIKKYRALR
ncbi:MAG: hypothetical protein H6555_09585 [Lewinellaceae bacterium]|nr:hypothetical protein [Lewinellaceae bacterium]